MNIPPFNCLLLVEREKDCYNFSPLKTSSVTMNTQDTLIHVNNGFSEVEL